MQLSKLAPELRGPARWMPTMTEDSATSRWLGRRITRLIPPSRINGVQREHRPQAPALRIYRPRAPRTRSALLWFHGGGFIMGAPAMDDRFCAETCRALGIVVVSVDYRLAPEHPFPAPLDDAFAAWRWLKSSSAALGVDPTRIVVGGQSAGGGLAASLVQRIHDAGEHAAGQWLFCPMLDDRTAAQRELDVLDHRVWNNRSNVIGWTHFLGRSPGAPHLAPYAAAARRASLKGLPPAWIGVGDIDLFFHEDRSYAERMRQDGVSVEFVAVAGAPHGFEAWARQTVIAQDFVTAARSWLADIAGVGAALRGVREYP